MYLLMSKKAIVLGFFLSVLLIGHSYAQEVKLIKLGQLESMISASSNELKVVNFWASWCAPCVKELPYFDALAKSGKARVYLVSLDFPEDLEKAKKILSKKGIGTPAYLLDEKNYDQYISKIDNSWSGAIPATLFVTPSGKKQFYESSFEESELQEVVKNLTTK